MRPTVSVSGGQRIGQRLRTLSSNLSKNNHVNVGVPAAAGSYEDGTPIAVIAAVQEFGSSDGHIPERSFLRVPLRANKQTYATILEKGLPSVIQGASSLYQIMNQMGARAVGDSQQAISEGIPPPNAPSTIRQKGSSTPLIDEGTLWQSITWVVGGDDES